MQQDADECWGNLLTSLKDKLKAGPACQPCLNLAFVLSGVVQSQLGAASAAWAGTRRLGRASQQPCRASQQRRRSRLCAAVQEGPSSDPVIRKLFGVQLHATLKAGEGEETIEVRHAAAAAAGKPPRHTSNMSLACAAFGCQPRAPPRCCCHQPPATLPKPQRLMPPSPSRLPALPAWRRWTSSRRSWCATSAWM